MLRLSSHHGGRAATAAILLLPLSAPLPACVDGGELRAIPLEPGDPGFTTAGAPPDAGQGAGDGTPSELDGQPEPDGDGSIADAPEPGDIAGEPDVPVDPCDPSPCAPPPGDLCKGLYEAVDVDDEAMCTVEGGSAYCTYGQVSVACDPSSELCFQGACVGAPPTCTPNPCEAPPEDHCLDDLTAIDVDEVASCLIVDGQPSCSWPESVTLCDVETETCQLGTCVSLGDPCDPNPCPAPEADHCEDTQTAIDVAEAAICTAVEGAPQCDAPEVEVPCEAESEICQLGVCVSVEDPCDPNPCPPPPEDHCANETDLVDVADASLCTVVEGEATCSHSEEVIPCAAEIEICLEGACAPVEADPCEPDPCPAPPADFCPSELLAVDVAEVSTCVAEAGEAVCGYEQVTTACDAETQVCQLGQCVSALDPCDPNPCVAPPDSCLSELVAVDVDEVATCEVVDGGADCSFSHVEIPCDPDTEVCQLGVCVSVDDPCSPDPCPSPPADSCAGPFTVLDVADAATCTVVEGAPSCSHTEVEVPCDPATELCDGGACVTPPDPCDPDPCGPPAADYCEDELTAIDVADAAVCSVVQGAASCSATEVEIPCSIGLTICEAGACVADPTPCDPNPCGPPPADSCKDELIAIDVADEATCEVVEGAPSCSAEEVEVPCQLGLTVCEGGECVPDPEPCVPSPCGPPPVDYCQDELTAVEVADEATCTVLSGLPSCEAAEVEVPCIPGLEVCEAGACVPDPTPCDPSPCGPPPADYCEDELTAVDVAEEATCTVVADAPSCTAVEVEVPCDPATQLCQGGSCVAKPGPCNPNPCGDGPDPFCQGDSVVSFAEVATCTVVADAPSCSWAQSSTPCDPDSEQCESGACVPEIPAPAVGEAIFTEIMRSPSGGGRQWVEVRNLASAERDLSSCTLVDRAGSVSSLEGGSLPVGPGQLLLLAEALSTSDGLPVPDGTFTGLDLGAEGADYRLRCGGEDIDAVDPAVVAGLDSFPSVAGSAMQLDNLFLDPSGNDDPAGWCAAYVPYGSGGNGTPAAHNPACDIEIDDCTLAISFAAAKKGEAFQVPGFFFEAGLTDKTPVLPDAQDGLVMQAGYAPQPPVVDPVDNPDGFTWFEGFGTEPPGALTVIDDDEDYYEAQVVFPDTGSYRAVVRFSLDDGVTWRYCDLDGGTFELVKQATISVTN